jgi:hypothetical protein
LICTGGPFFNLFNLGKTEAAMKELKLKEIKNGRLVRPFGCCGVVIWRLVDGFFRIFSGPERELDWRRRLSVSHRLC